ncbi:MAG: hypothetical protein HY928_05540, partial [Elusimicrobia bacterium]|nr:hypothetical protein [Elusimicrobiota bacterium]
MTNIRLGAAVAVPVGQTRTFTILFDIMGTATDGSFNMTIKDMIGDAVDPDPQTNDTPVNLVINTPPRISRSDRFGPDPSGPFEGAANTPATTPTLRDPVQLFSFDHLGAPSHVFSIYNSPDLATPLIRREFAAGAKTASYKEPLSDSDFYAAAIVDSFGLSTTYYFKLDNSAPVVRADNITLAANASLTAPVMSISGTASDPVSGIAYLRMARGELLFDTNGFVSSILPGDIDNGVILATAAIAAGAKTGAFSFAGLEAQTVHSIGAADTQGLRSSPPLDVTVARTPLVPFLPTPTEIRGQRTLLGAADGSPAVARFLRSLSLTTRMDFPTQTGAINVYLSAGPNAASEAAFAGVLTDNLPNLPRTWVGSVSGNGTTVLDINRLTNGGMSIELEGPDVASSLPGAAPTLTGVTGSIDDFSLRTTPPSLPLEVDGTFVPVPAGRNVVITVDGVAVTVEEITVPGAIRVAEAPFAAGTGIATIPPGVAASVEVEAVYTGPLKVERIVQEADILGGNPANVRFAQHDALEKFLVLPTQYALISPGQYQFSATAVGASFFPLLIRADGSPVPDADTAGPSSTIDFAGGSYASAQGEVFVSTATGIVLGASDDFSGVERSLYAVDHPELTGANFGPATEAAFNDYQQPFEVQEGRRLLAWGAADRARNFGNLQTMEVSADGTPPATELFVAGPSVVLSSGELVVGPNTTLALGSADPVTNGVAAGVGATLVLLDETAASCGLSLDAPPVVVPGAPQGSCGNPFYGAPFNVPVSTHTVRFFSLDNVLNLEPVRSTTVVGDYAPPGIALTPVPSFVAAKRPALSASFSDSLAGLSTAALRLELDGSSVPATLSIPSGGGSLGPWSSAGTLYSPLTGQGFVAYNGWLYSMGGFNGTAVSDQVRFAKINPDGSVGAWTQTATLPEPRIGFAAAAANGTLYVMDGGNGTVGSSVFYAKINGDGSLAAWQTGNSLPVALQDTDGVAIIAQGAYLFVIGGYQSDRVYSAPIEAGGAPGTWTLLSTRLPKVLRQAKAVALGNRIYLMGGMTSDALSSNLKDTYIGQVSGGNVTAWVPGPDLPVAVSFAAAAGADGMILYGGGFLPDNSITARTFTSRVEGAGL